MVKTDRESRHIAPNYVEVENTILNFCNREATQFRASIDEGTVCAGCEKEIPEDAGVECYCAVEDFGRAHELYKWCTQDCFNRTHEDCHPDPPDREEYDG